MAPSARPHGFARRHVVETPEHVLIELELAGVGSRFAAAVYDTVIVVLLIVACLLVLVFTSGGGGLGHWAVAIMLLVAFLVQWGYFALCEGLLRGLTAGKKRVGLRVVMDTGHPVTFGAAVTRNLLRIVDIQPAGSYAVGSLFIFFHPQHKRLGDVVAGTIVVRDRADAPLLAHHVAPAREVAAVAAAADAGSPELADNEYRLIEQFMGRRDELDPEARRRLVASLLIRFADRIPAGARGVEGRLEALYAAEQARRQGRMAAVIGSRGAPAAAAARFVARHQDVWERFRVAAVAAERQGLRQMDGEALTGFAAQYREVAADLARARTYGVDARTISALERIVGAGHNALYGLRGVRRTPLGRLALVALPAAAWRGRAWAAAAAVILLVPAVVSYGLVVGNPDRAAQWLPDEMVSRAETGAAQAREGTGYMELPSLYLPVVASQIIANNVQVSFAAFAFGITAGLGTVVVLFFNGMSIGAVIGLFANYGLAGWLLTFMAGHGVLELTAIAISGGAGLRIAGALVAPGDRSRADALVVEGRSAFLMVAAAGFLLILAGTIEGLLSASAAPAATKLGVSAASAVLLVLLAVAGRRAAAAELVAGGW